MGLGDRVDGGERFRRSSGGCRRGGVEADDLLVAPLGYLADIVIEAVLLEVALAPRGGSCPRLPRQGEEWMAAGPVHALCRRAVADSLGVQPSPQAP